MFFNKGKRNTPIPDVTQEIAPEAVLETEVLEETEKTDVSAPEEGGSTYAFYKPDPYPKELVSVLSKMLQRLFPDTKRAYLLEAQKSDKKGYLLIVDIDSKFLKIINIYLDSETKRVRGDIPIECVLYSKSGSLTEGIDPFYAKESAQSNANNLASKEFSGEIVFSQMPEFELWKGSEKKAPKNEDANLADGKPTDQSNEAKEEPLAEDAVFTNEKAQEKKEAPAVEKAPNPELSKDRKPVIIPVKPKEKNEEKTNAKVKPVTKKELFGIINEYGAKKSGEVSAVAIAAIKEYEFYIPYTLGKQEESAKIDTSLPIDENLRFKKLVNPEDEIQAVPLFTEKDDALSFAQRDKCKIVRLKYKDFAASQAAELTGFDGVIINPMGESIFLLLSHPLLG